MDGGGESGGSEEPVRHGRSAPPSGALRTVLVVALVAAAAVLLSARDGLDWEGLADPLDVRWARVIVGTVVVLLMVAATRSVLHRLRRARPRPAAPSDRAELEGEPIPLVLRLLAVVLVLGTLAVAWWVIGAVTAGVPDPVAPRSADDGPSDPSLPGSGPDWPTLLLVGAALVAVALVSRLQALRGVVEGDGRDDESGQGDREVASGSEAGELSSAVAAGQAELTGHQDARAAILAAYAAMAARIESGLAAGGRSASAADTPTELLTRAGVAGLVDGTAAFTLTALFREARFSRHPMGEAHRRDAEQALATVRNELEARRA